MNILITGANGQLGRELNQQLYAKQEITLFNTEVKEDIQRNITAMDITSLDDVLRIVKEKSPDIIINCAAYTAVDLCETEKESAYKVNAEGPKNLAIAAKRYGAKLIHISTDYVFEGNGKRPYVESDQVNPQSVYGATKLAGEQFVQQNCEQYFIIRTAWLYGDGKNFVKTMLALAEKYKEIKVVNDQYGTPTSAKELARLITYLMEKECYGIYHGTCEGVTTWYDFAVEIFKEAGKNVLVIPVSTKEYASPTKRPAYSVLENQKLKTFGDYEMKNWKEALKDYFAESNVK